MRSQFVKRALDLIISGFALVVLLLPMLAIALLIKVESSGPALYWSDRVGRRGGVFRMPKFRSMRTDTPVVATHLLRDPERYITQMGRLLRRTSLDELPQLYSVMVGDMSLVGPRPALFNQNDLIALRTEHEVDSLRPGITGWAQINGRDELPISEKVAFDVEYLQRRSLVFDLKILFLTFWRVVTAHGVSH